MEKRYLELLGKMFPTIEAAATEIINLEAILSLPKGTEHFLSDIHGEHEAFDHVIRNASGAVVRKVNDEFGKELREKEKHDLCTLIYYPKERLEIVKAEEENLDEWYNITLIRLVRICRAVSSKYTRSKVRKTLPEAFSYIIQELMHESEDDENKTAYVHAILRSIIDNGRSDAFIIAMCTLIQRLVIDRLHLVGDIYDRGPGAHLILDQISQYHDMDIQWGNHDLVWMGAAAGNETCIATVIRLSLRYANLNTLEDGYGINMLPLATFAMEVYENDPCTPYIPKLKFADVNYDERNVRLISQMHKAISIIQWKLEHSLFERNPEWNMEFRDRLHLVDQERGVVTIDGIEYPMKDPIFPTVSKENPYELTPGERNLMDKLCQSFAASQKLAQHLRLLLDKGSMYLVCNGNLLFHASVPMNADGTFREINICGKTLSGKAYLDEVDRLIRIACLPCRDREEYQTALDYMWYWWCGPDSPSFDKHQMANFERYLLSDKEPQKEIQGPYYKLRTDSAVCDRILDEFGVIGEHRHIINGHVPVEQIHGESPIKCGGKLLVIDGGFSKAYHKKTGNAGYTLVCNSRGMRLVAHKPFESTREAIVNETDIVSEAIVVEKFPYRKLVNDTDIGAALRERIYYLEQLLEAFEEGVIAEEER